MGWSSTVGSIRGIEIRIHVSFLLIIGWAAYNWGIVLRGGWSGAVYGVVFTLIVFLCVVIHEVAHSLVAMRCGVRVHEIELSPIGGLARMDEIPDTPSHELTMALAGPVANLLLAVPLGIGVAWLVSNHPIRSLGHLLYLMRKPSWQGFVISLFATNVFLALFNLFPAFPMDGGRVLRSLLSLAVGRGPATRWAASMGQWLAAVMGLVGLLIGNLILTLVAAFVFVSARQEQRLSDLQTLLGDMPISEALSSQFATLTAQDTLATVLEQAKRGQSAPFAVVDGSRLVGVLTASDITAALEVYGSSALVGHIMRQEWPQASPSDSLATARQRMARSGLEAIPVVEDGQLLGMVTAQQIQQLYEFVAAQQRQPGHGRTP